MPTQRFPLVGAHFRPPAKLIIENLPAETELLLEPEPDNPWDPKAIKVLIRSSQIPEESLARIEPGLEGFGLTLTDLLGTAVHHLGYIARNSAKVPIGNEQALEMMLEPYQAKLCFAMDGKPEVRIQTEAP